MNVYDFDNTIFRGDSTARFLAFCACRYPRIWRHFPGIARAGVAFLRKKMAKTAFKQKLFEFLVSLPDTHSAVDLFWQKNERHIKFWYPKQQKADDVIISASPEFLIAPLAQKMGFHLIASRVNPENGVYSGINCDGEEKVTRFRAEFPSIVPDTFYSDSYSDNPMARISAKAYFVKGDTLIPWEERFPS